MRHYLLDVRWGARRLVRAWRLALTCVAFLAVAIGATTTVFSFVNAALLRPLPYPDADRLVAISEDNAELPPRRMLVSAATLAALRRGTASFESLGAYGDDAAVVAVGENLQTLFVTGIDSGVLGTLRMRPQLGAVPTSAQHAASARVALVSEAFWRSQMGGTPDAIGRSIRLNDTAYQVLGVMPRGFAFSAQSDIWIPLNERESRWWPGQQPWFSVIARLKPGVTHAQARQELSIIEARLRAEAPAHWRRMRLAMRDDAVFRVTRMWKPVLLLFLGGVGAVLLVACVNVGTLLSMRASEQRGVVAVHAAMGASPARLIAYTLVESLLLILAGAALGLALSLALVPALERVALLQHMPQWFRTDLDHRVFLFVTGLAALAVLLVGVRAVSHSFNLDVANVLRRSGEGGTTSSEVTSSGTRGVIIQVALSVVLAVASTLLVVTYHRVTDVDVGYARDRIVTVAGFIDRRLVSSDLHRWERMRALAANVAELGGVEGATLRGDLVRYRAAKDSALEDVEVFAGLSGRPADHRGWIFAQKVVVDPNYFSTLQIPVLRGRAFSGSDSGSSVTPVVLSATAAEMLWAGQPALGRVMRIGSNGPPLTVIGIVGDVRRSGVGPDGMGVWAIPMLYLPSTHAVGTTPVVHARVASNPHAIRAMIGPAVLRNLGPTPFAVRTPDMEEDEFVVLLRTSGVLFASSAFIACLLAGLGVYAVVRFRGQQRQREIGIRMSLGATAGQIRWDIARECLLHGGAGLVAGLAASAVLAQALRSAIWGVSPFSAAVYGGVAAVMVTLIGAAGYAASRRAGRVDPAAVMRN